ncbi:CAAX protease [Bacillus manliponensis]|uniref:CAAX protease n=1 Tax=Bacillus manliponensis TaxID=574376 RepID=A0A073JVS5_9BACI|nr:type II CAAX endopeptidase family protein [Bacillus manliponensis]KEK18322.1 CAAX protease [Bacillus manliponensis]
MIVKEQVIQANTKWSKKEFLLILSFFFIFVPFFLEYLLQRQLYSMFQNSLYAGTLTGFFMAVTFLLAIYYITLKPFQLSWRHIGLHFPKGYWLPTIYWTIILVILSIATVVVMDIIGINAENSKTDSLQMQITPFTFSIAFISAVIISPFYEEILYRGFLYKWLRGRLGVTSSLLCSALIFTLVHIPTYNALPMNFISGLVFAWTYEKSGSIIPAMVIHAFFNGLAITLTALS